MNYDWSNSPIPVIFLPRLCPVVSKVNNENKLDQNEQESANHPKVHPDLAERPVRNAEEGADNASHDQDELDPPEPWKDKNCFRPSCNPGKPFTVVLPVLYNPPGIPGAPHPDHYDSHEQEEQGDDEANSIHGQVADKSWEITNNTFISHSIEKVAVCQICT